jgi:DNA polymerase III sliding clamp (beta) subunit (PCNA family)
MVTGSREKQTLILFSTNRKLAGMGVCPARISDDFQILVSGTKLAKLAELIESESILVITVDDQKMVIESGDFNCQLQVTTQVKFPQIPDLDGFEFASVSCESLLSHLQRIFFCSCNNSGRKHLTTIHIGGGFIWTSNGQITTICKCSLSGRINGLMIPGGVVQSLISFLRRVEAIDVRICETNNFVVFKIGATHFLARKSSNKLPGVVSPIVNPIQNIKTIASFDKTDLKTAVQRVSITCNTDTLGVSIKFFKEHLFISSCDQTGNRSQEIIPCTWNGSEGVEHRLNYIDLLNILKSLSVDSVCLRISEDEQLPVCFQDGDLTVFLKRQIL